MKRLRDAIRDNDNIRAVIRGTGSNQDGKTPGKTSFRNYSFVRLTKCTGITQPSKRAQEQMMRDTYERAGLKPDATRYVEAHGTGTPIGGWYYRLP